LSKYDVPVNLRVPGIKLPLRNYQKLGVQFCMTNGEGALVADEMGLGKTAQAIATALFMKSKGLAKKVLVITPASLKYNWPIELMKFCDEKYVVIDGTPDERMAQWLRDDAFFYVVNFELITEDLFGGQEKTKKEKETPEEKAKRMEYEAKMSRRMRLLGPARTRRWDMIIVDEVHSLKHHAAKRTLNVKKMHGRFRMGLTGTPLDGRLEELHSVMGFVYPGLLESKTRFMQKHAVCDPFGKVIRYKKIGIVRSRIEPFFIRRLKSQVLKELPDKIYQNIMVQLTKEEMAIYEALATNGHKMTEDAQAMVAVIRCKQFCDHPSLIDEKCKSSKLEALKEVLQEVILDNGHKVLIFTQYAQMAARLLKEFDAMGLKYMYLWGETPKKVRADMQQQFTDDKSIDLMIGTEAMSQGLNFTAADYVVNYDDNWAPAIMRQRADRAHRIGQKNVVTVVNFICRNTIEERIRDVLLAKDKVSAQVLGDDTDVAVIKRLGPQDIAKML
jgi:SNF2 family DNA or RNA helicase